MCPEKELKVTLRLHATLSALISAPLAGCTHGDVVSASVPPLLVDQLCINQSEEIERAQGIYQRANLEILSLSL